MERLAVLLTCYNRKLKTLECLESLFKQELPPNTTLDVYLVDDGSTDGTAAAVGTIYPQVKIILGTGNLFWNGGMRLAFGEALQGDYDGYIWLNDDTILDAGALKVLLVTLVELGKGGYERAIVLGSTRDPLTQTLTYGGLRQISPFHPPFKGKLLTPTDQPQSCDLMCGNIVLIPRVVVALVGNLDPQLTHYAGDWDYGLRAKQKGCTLWITPGYLGTCPLNPKPDPASLPSRAEGLKKIAQPKGLALADVTLQPFEEWKLLMKRHGGIFWFIFWLLPYRRLWLRRIEN